jgi:sugar phosphate isomerase/epimerase
MMIPAIWTAMYAELPLHDAFRVLNGCGWRAFEISTEHLVGIETDRDADGLIEKARDSLHDLGLSAPQAHAYLNAEVAEPDAQKRERDINRLLRHIDIAARLGVRCVVIHPGGEHCTVRTERECIQKLNIEAFRRLGDFAGERGVRIGLENLTQPGATTPAELIDLLKRIDRPTIGITLDTSHVNMSALNVAQVVRDCGPHLVATHISDNNGSGDQHLTPGGGTIDWPAVMEAFRDIHYQGLFNLEIPGERHAVLGLRQLKTRFALDVARWLIGLADSNY